MSRQVPIAFATAGGDAWTFEKLIELSVAADRCDQIVVTSPIGAVSARPWGGHAIARVPLGGGVNPIAAQCWRRGTRVGAPIRQTWRVPIEDVPRARIHAIVAAGRIDLDGEASELAPGRAAPIVRYEWSGGGARPDLLADLPAQGPRVAIGTPAADGDYVVRLRVEDAAGRSSSGAAMFRVRDGAPQLVDQAFGHASWIDDAVVYGVVPSLFGARGFADVTDQLDRLAALGVNTLWLVPVTATPHGDFGYAVSDPFGLRSDFGTEAELRSLIQAAHARGLKVIFDMVANHLSDQSAYFADAQANAKTSPYFDFFSRSPEGDVISYFNWTNLKNLNYDNPEVQRLLIEASAHWVRAFDIDGFRVDAAWGPRDRAPEFWPRWREALKRIKPDLLLLAEGSALDPYYAHLGFDAAYDWTRKLGEWAWQDAFADEQHTAERLRAAIASSQGAGLVFRFLDNNDTGERFITRYGVDRTRLAAAMLLTLPGLPQLFTGDELGAAYQPYASRGPISWDDHAGLETWYARLIALRHAEPALRSRNIRLLDTADQVLAYLRPGETPSDSILVLLNYGAAPARIALSSDVLAEMDPGGSLVDLIDGERFERQDGGLDLTLDGYGARILQSRPISAAAAAR